MSDIFIGELIGTFILVVFGVGAGANLNLNKTFANGGGWIVTSFAWGLLSRLVSTFQISLVRVVILIQR